MKCIIEFELPDNDTVLKDIKVEPVHWAYHGYSGYCKAKQKVKRKKGKWIVEYQPNGKPYCLHCSVCDGDGSFIGITTAYNFCPNCGAEMESET